MTSVHPHVVRLTLHPIKSLDGVEVAQVTVLLTGALQHDREFALFDSTGTYINGKRNQRIHVLRARFDLAQRQLHLTLPKTPSQSFHLDQERSQLIDCLGGYFGQSVELHHNPEMGFPDDQLSPGPTLISTATLEAVTRWYPGSTLAEMRRRFRTNIEIDGVPAFWEDRLFGLAETTPIFKIGEVELQAINPCQRCVVVTRDSQTGEADRAFQKTFTQQRQVSLPDWVEASRFNHFFRLAINTRLGASQAGQQIRVGDRLSWDLAIGG